MTNLSDSEEKELLDLKLALINNLTIINHMIYSREDRLSDDVKKLKYLHKEINNLVDEINRVLYR